MNKIAHFSRAQRRGSSTHAAVARRLVLTRLVKRSFSLAGHRTSVALESEFWSALTRVAATRGNTLSALVSAADAERTPMQPLASALRVLALRAFDQNAGPAAPPASVPPRQGVDEDAK